MVSKSKSGVVLLAAAFASCSSVLPWHDQPVADELNLAFTVRNNLLFLPSATINGRTGRFFFGSAESRSVVDPRVVQALGESPFNLQLGSRDSVRFAPVVLDLGAAGDAIIGADVWEAHAVTIDYRAGLLTYEKDRVEPAYMTMFHYDGPPAIDVVVAGQTIAAVVDTALPDTLVLPRATPGRGMARVVLAGADFGNIDVKYANVSQPRVGNRLLSKFLVTIDYGKHNVGLWRDPRIP